MRRQRGSGKDEQVDQDKTDLRIYVAHGIINGLKTERIMWVIFCIGNVLLLNSSYLYVSFFQNLL